MYDWISEPVGQLHRPDQRHRGPGINTLAEREKYNIVRGMENWALNKSAYYPKTTPKSKTDCHRSLKPDWRKRFPWLTYSWAHDGCHCSSCVLFCTSKEPRGVLMVKPWRHWSKSNQDLARHNDSLFRKEAQVAADHFETMVDNQERSIKGMQKEMPKKWKNKIWGSLSRS